MPLPKIDNPAPVVIPPVEAKTYDAAHIVGLTLDEPVGDGRQQLRVMFRPYNYDTGELYPNRSQDQPLVIWDVWAEAARNPLFAQAMGGIVQVGALLLKERHLVHAIPEATEESRPALEAELSAVRLAMGITAQG